MAGSTPIYGLPYPEPSDLVANYPALGESLAETLDEKLPTYAATAPASPSVGQVWIDSDDNLGRVWTGSVWQLFSGAGPANFSDTATGTYTDSGINYKFITYTSSGTLTVTRDGLADILLIAGGGGGIVSSPGGGGAGGYEAYTNAYLTSGTYTITVGAGGSATTNGNYSAFGSLVVDGGGLGQSGGTPGNTGGSSGGGGQSATVVTNPTFGGLQGFAGGKGNGGGGGAGGTGYDGYGAGIGLPNGGLGGAGVASSITGTSVTRASGGSAYYAAPAATRSAPVAGGGGGAGKLNGDANTGGGGAADGGLGGSGVVIVRVRTS